MGRVGMMIIRTNSYWRNYWDSFIRDYAFENGVNLLVCCICARCFCPRCRPHLLDSANRHTHSTVMTEGMISQLSRVATIDIYKISNLIHINGPQAKNTWLFHCQCLLYVQTATCWVVNQDIRYGALIFIQYFTPQRGSFGWIPDHLPPSFYHPNAMYLLCFTGTQFESYIGWIWDGELRHLYRVIDFCLGHCSNINQQIIVWERHRMLVW